MPKIDERVENEAPWRSSTKPPIERVFEKTTLFIQAASFTKSECRLKGAKPPNRPKALARLKN